MLRIPWDLTEAVMLVNAFYQNNQSTSFEVDYLHKLHTMFLHRASNLNIKHDEKYRNIPGLKMQLECVRYVVTEGNLGMPNASKVFYEAVRLYKENHMQFEKLLQEFLSAAQK